MASIPNPHSSQGTTYDPFWARVTRTDATHDFTALFGIEGIHILPIANVGQNPNERYQFGNRRRVRLWQVGGTATLHSSG
jgi:hypothetical protein